MSLGHTFHLTNENKYCIEDVHELHLFVINENDSCLNLKLVVVDVAFW